MSISSLLTQVLFIFLPFCVVLLIIQIFVKTLSVLILEIFIDNTSELTLTYTISFRT